MSYFAKLKAAIRKARTPKQSDALASKLFKAELELANLRTELMACQARCSHSSVKFVLFDKYTNQLYGKGKSRSQMLRLAKTYPDSARIMPAKQWLAEGNSL